MPCSKSTKEAGSKKSLKIAKARFVNHLDDRFWVVCPPLGDRLPKSSGSKRQHQAVGNPSRPGIGSTSVYWVLGRTNRPRSVESGCRQC